MKCILVAGGAGFIGTNLCLRLSKSSKVVAVDNLITGDNKNVLKLKKAGVTFFKKDISQKIPINFKIDEIYDLACPTGVDNLLKFGEEMLLTSSIGTKNLLQLALLNNANLLYASSSEIYGNPLVTPQSENYSGNVDPIGPRSTYEEGKRFGESLVKLYSRKYGIKAKIARIFNTFGPFMSLSDSRVIPSFIKSISKNDPLIINGTGTNKRTFCYVDDLIEGLIIIMRKGETGEAYNIGSTEQISIIDLARKIKNLTGKNNGIKFLKPVDHDHKQRNPDVAKISELGWIQKTSLTEGIRRTLKWYGL